MLMQVVLREGESPRAAGTGAGEAVRREEDQEESAPRAQQPQEVARPIQEVHARVEGRGGEGEAEGPPTPRKDQAGRLPVTRKTQK